MGAVTDAEIREALLEQARYRDELWRANGFESGEDWAFHCLVNGLNPNTGFPDGAPSPSGTTMH